MVDKSAHYLMCKGGVYYFTRHVPNDLQRHYEKPRVVMCLKTRSRNSAECALLGHAGSPKNIICRDYSVEVMQLAKAYRCFPLLQKQSLRTPYRASQEAYKQNEKALWIVFEETVPPSTIWVEYKVKQIYLPIIDGPPLDIALDMSDGELCHAYR